MKPSELSRRTFIKLAGLTFTGSLLSACAQESITLPANIASTEVPPPLITPTSIPSSTPPLQQKPTHTIPPTAVNTLTSTPFPTLTPTSIPVQENSNGDVLTDSQRDRLIESALKYTADNEYDAIHIARSLGYIKNDGHPASVCGPLAAAVLRDAGLISSYTDLHEFWLLNPRENIAVLERTFPEDSFAWFHTAQSVAEFNFNENPLKAGDFLYLYAGDPGSFEHMLTVSRVDEMGRAYAVTNFDTLDGFVIQEVLLYDPHQEGIGKLYDWTDRKNSKLGLTGFGGFLMIRFQIPVRDQTQQELKLSAAFDEIIQKYGGLWRIYIKALPGDVIYARHDRRTLHPASVIKVPIAMLFFESLIRQGVADFDETLQKGIDGRAYKQLIRAMLVNSEEEATDSIEKAIYENHLDARKTLQAWGADHTYIDFRLSTAREIGVLMEGLYSGNYLPTVPRQKILDLLSVYTPGDDLRLGVIRQFIPPGSPFYNKRGTITDDLLVVADAAIVRVPTPVGEIDYVITAFGYQDQENKTTYSKMEYAMGEMAKQLWLYTREL